MSRKLHQVELTGEERQRLQALFRGGSQPVRLLTRARILLLADEGRTDETIVERVGCNLSTVERTRKRYGRAGIDGALHESPRPGGAKKLDDKQAAILPMIGRLKMRVVDLELDASATPILVGRSDIAPIAPRTTPTQTTADCCWLSRWLKPQPRARR